MILRAIWIVSLIVCVNYGCGANSYSEKQGEAGQGTEVPINDGARAERLVFAISEDGKIVYDGRTYGREEFVRMIDGSDVEWKGVTIEMQTGLMREEDIAAIYEAICENLWRMGFDDCVTIESDDLAVDTLRTALTDRGTIVVGQREYTVEEFEHFLRQHRKQYSSVEVYADHDVTFEIARRVFNAAENAGIDRVSLVGSPKMPPLREPEW